MEYMKESLESKVKSQESEGKKLAPGSRLKVPSSGMKANEGMGPRGQAKVLDDALESWNPWILQSLTDNLETAK